MFLENTMVSEKYHGVENFKVFEYNKYCSFINCAISNTMVFLVF